MKGLQQTDEDLVHESRERERVEDQLRRSEAYLTEAQRLSHTGSFGWNLSSGEIHWSAETFRIFDLDPTQTVTISQIRDRTHPEDRVRVQQLIDGATARRSSFEFEHRLIMPDGSIKHVQILGRPVENDEGQLEFVGAITDVSDRKRVEEALRRSEAYLADSQRMSHTASWAVRPGASSAHYWSEEMFRIWGYNPEDGIPSVQSTLGRVHPEDGDRISQISQQMSSGDLTHDIEGEHRILLPDGTVKHVHTKLHSVLDDAGRVVEFVGTSVDETERKCSVEALRRSETYLAEAQRLSHTGSWALDPATGETTFYSDEMFRIMGLEPSLQPPDWETISQRLHPEDRSAVRAGIEKMVAVCKMGLNVTEIAGLPGLEDLAEYLRGNRGSDKSEVRVILPNGPLRYLQAHGHPALDETGKIVEWVGTTVDVTEQKQAEFERERLRKLEADLAHMNRISMMGELAASLSHELRQPIAAGIVSAGTAVNWLTQDPPNVEDACQAALNAVKAGERAAEIIDWVQSQYKKSAPRCVLLDANKTICEVVEMLRSEANRCKVSINTDLIADLPSIRSDRVQLQQVLMNLILNAIEAMKEMGGCVSVESRVNEDGFMQISVSDTGPGLPAIKEEKIFEPFFTTKSQGSGMGLAICRSIIESQGGRLWATSSSEGGATFQFTLPTTEAAAQA